MIPFSRFVFGATGVHKVPSWNWQISIFIRIILKDTFQKQPSRSILRKNCSKICRTPTPKCDIEIELRHGYSPVNLLHFFRTPFPKNTCGRQLLAFPNLRQFLATKSPLKMMENVFYLTSSWFLDIRRG